MLIACIAAFLGVGLIGGSLWAAYRAFVERDLRVILMPDGFVVTRDGQHEIFRWDDIASVWQAITVHKRYGMTVSTTYNYTIQRSDGCKIVLNNNTKGIDKLGQEIQNQFTRAMLPKAIETLNPEGP